MNMRSYKMDGLASVVMDHGGTNSDGVVIVIWLWHCAEISQKLRLFVHINCYMRLTQGSRIPFASVQVGILYVCNVDIFTIHNERVDL
jgi:hypothetical protein